MRATKYKTVLCLLRWRSVTLKLGRVDSRKKSRSCSSRPSRPLLAPQCSPSPLPPRSPPPLLLPLSFLDPPDPTRAFTVTKWISAMLYGHSRRSIGCRQKSCIWRERWHTGGEYLRLKIIIRIVVGDLAGQTVTPGSWHNKQEPELQSLYISIQ